MGTRRWGERKRSGCMPLLLTCLASCILLALNAAFVNAFLDGIMSVFPAWLRRPKVEQTLLFVLPVLITALQWWVVDWILFQSRDRNAVEGDLRGPHE